MSYSQTQASNITAFVGLLVLVFPKLAGNQSEIETAAGALIVLGGIVWNWVHRHSKGDLTIAGVRKY